MIILSFLLNMIVMLLRAIVVVLILYDLFYLKLRERIEDLEKSLLEKSNVKKTKKQV